MYADWRNLKHNPRYRWQNHSADKLWLRCGGILALLAFIGLVGTWRDLTWRRTEATVVRANDICLFGKLGNSTWVPQYSMRPAVGLNRLPCSDIFSYRRLKDEGNKVTGAYWDTEITYTDPGGKRFTSNIRVDTYQVDSKQMPAPEVAKRRQEMGLDYPDLAAGDKLRIAHSPSSPELVKLAQSLNIHFVSWFLAYVVAAAFAVLVLRSKVVRPTKRDDAW